MVDNPYAEFQSDSNSKESSNPYGEFFAGTAKSGEPTVKMYKNGHENNPVAVSASDIDDYKKQGYYPVLNEQQKAAGRADAINPSATGNVVIMAAPLAVPAAATEAAESYLGSAIDPAISALGNAAKTVAQNPTVQKAAKYVGGKLVGGALTGVGLGIANKFLPFKDWFGTQGGH
jgi:hypothetical protein